MPLHLSKRLLVRAVCLMLVCFLSACAGNTAIKQAAQPTNAAQQGGAAILSAENAVIYEQAIEDMQQAKWAEALDSLSRIEAVQPGLAKVMTNLAICFHQTGESDKAQVYLLSTYEQHPSYLDALIVGAEIHRDLGQFSQARDRLLAVIKIEPDTRIAHYNLGIINELYLYDYAAAKHHYQRYVALAGDEENNETKLVSQWIKLLERK